VVYLERFTEMVNDIESHPLLEVVDFRVNPPASDEIMTLVEERLGVPLSDPIRTFYQETNGLRLYWKIKPGLTDEELDVIEEEYDDYDIGVPDEEEDTDDENPFAHINFLSIEDCIINRDWRGKIIYDEITSDEETVNFSGVTYQEKTFQNQLKPFDLFSSYACMAFFLEEGVSDPKILRLSGHYAEWDNSKVTNFKSYMEMLFVTRGIVDARGEIYSEYRGDRKPLLITNSDYWNEENIPKLFRNRN
jgi:hypothetical protein